jgi:hypothetical protein
MPCNEVVEVGGLLDIFYGVNDQATRSGATDDMAYAVEVVSPVQTCARGRVSASSPSGPTALSVAPSTR